MDRFLVLGLLVVLGVVASSPPALADPVKVTAKNRSSWTLAHVHVSLADRDDWGTDVLGGNPIELGEGFSFQVPACDSYDMKVVDSAGRECVIPELAFCTDANVWVLTEDALRECDRD